MLLSVAVVLLLLVLLAVAAVVVVVVAAAVAVGEAAEVRGTVVAPEEVVVVPVDRRLSLRLAADEELGEVDLERLS